MSKFWHRHRLATITGPCQCRFDSNGTRFQGRFWPKERERERVKRGHKRGGQQEHGERDERSEKLNDGMSLVFKKKKLNSDCQNRRFTSDCESTSSFFFFNKTSARCWLVHKWTFFFSSALGVNCLTKVKRRDHILLNTDHKDKFVEHYTTGTVCIIRPFSFEFHGVWQCNHDFFMIDEGLEGTREESKAILILSF